MLALTVGTAHQIRKFNNAMESIGAINRDARRWLENIPLEKWSLTHDGGHRWGIITTNHCEVFNSVLKGARALPITACVQLIFYRVVLYFDEGRVKVNKSVCNGFMYARKVLEKIDIYQKKANVHELQAYNRLYLYTSFCFHQPSYIYPYPLLLLI